MTGNGETRGITNAATRLKNDAYKQVIDTAKLFGAAKVDPVANLRRSLIEMFLMVLPKALHDAAWRKIRCEYFAMIS